MLLGPLQSAVPTVEEEAIYVALDQKDAALAHPMGVFVLGAVDLLTAELGLAGGLLLTLCNCLPSRCWGQMHCRWGAQHAAGQLICLPMPLPAVPAEVAALPAVVRVMLLGGRWCNTAARWTVAGAEAQQAAPRSVAQQQDATHALLLVRAAVAALALISDVGYEAAIRHLSQEFYAVAAKVCCLPRQLAASPCNVHVPDCLLAFVSRALFTVLGPHPREHSSLRPLAYRCIPLQLTRGGPAASVTPGGSSDHMPLTTGLPQQLSQEVEQADVLTGAFR